MASVSPGGPEKTSPLNDALIRELQSNQKANPTDVKTNTFSGKIGGHRKAQVQKLLGRVKRASGEIKREVKSKIARISGNRFSWGESKIEKDPPPIKTVTPPPTKTEPKSASRRRSLPTSRKESHSPPKGPRSAPVETLMEKGRQAMRKLSRPEKNIEGRRSTEVDHNPTYGGKELSKMKPNDLWNIALKAIEPNTRITINERGKLSFKAESGASDKNAIALIKERVNDLLNETTGAEKESLHQAKDWLEGIDTTKE